MVDFFYCSEFTNVECFHPFFEVWEDDFFICQTRIKIVTTPAIIPAIAPILIGSRLFC